MNMSSLLDESYFQKCQGAKQISRTFLKDNFGRVKEIFGCVQDLLVKNFFFVAPSYIARKPRTS